MKIWKKIFLYSIVLFIILFNSAGILIVENIHNRNLEMTISTAIIENNSIKSSIYLNSDLLKGYNIYYKDKISVAFRSYIYSDTKTIKNIELFSTSGESIINTADFFFRGKS